MKRIATLLFFLLPSLLFAQNVYNMANMTVNDCQGIFMDSDAGFPAGDYDHNEDLTFRICVPQATQIVMSFQSFCSEPIIDSIRFFDGPDTNSPLIFGPHAGSTLPPNIVATSGCLTIHFKSDANLACEGWVANWYSIVPPPIPPIITNIQATCTSNSIIVDTDSLIHCDSIYPSAFTLTGGSGYNIISTNPINCINDSTNQFELILDNPLTDCGNYNLDFALSIADACDSVYDFILTDNFDIYDCPITADILYPTDSVCIGDCIDITGFGDGGDCNLQYTWSTGWANSTGPFQLCPTGDTTIQLIVFDFYGNDPDTAEVLIRAFPVPDAGPDTSWCINAGTFFPGNADIPGGYWWGPGITDSLTGEFDPQISGAGQHYIYYTNVICTDSLLVDVFTVYAGPDQASCPGQNPFQLIGANPTGGYYLGLFTDSTGLFSPDSIGAFTITYHLNGCVDSLVVTVDTVSFTSPDSVCESETAVQLLASPNGGTWSGTGIVDAQNGIFNANLAGGGLHTIYYDIVGCRDSITIFVKSIYAGPNRTACPSEAPFTLGPGSPTGGTWQGNGITDALTGMYDPSWSAGTNANDTVLYLLDGCVDTLMVFIRATIVGVDSLQICVNEAAIALNFANTQRRPGGGNWSGSVGITDPNGPGTFDPAVAGVGFHTLVYTVNSCSDSMIVEVIDLPAIDPVAAMCEYDNPINLTATPAGGVWSGNEIININTGLFDPDLAGPGNHWVYYETLTACVDSIQVQVDAIPVIDLSAMQQVHCFNSNVVNLNISPPGGQLTGPGASGSNSFNSAQAGTGIHSYQYIAQNGTCTDTIQFQLQVLDTLEVSTDIIRDTICFGDSISVSAQAFFGNGGPYTYTWDNGAGNGATVVLNPSQTTTYTVTASDGCSNPASTQVEIYVHPEIVVNINHSPTICYADEATVTVSGSGNYAYEWSTDPVQYGSSMTARPGDYQLTITDLNTGCVIIDSTTIPSYPYINAAFSKIPNRPCMLMNEDYFTVLDLSAGADGGYWYFSTGDTIPYVYGEQPIYDFTDTGMYYITLVLFNNGGCTSVFTDSICVKAEPLLHIPSGFSPNNDAINDFFEIYAIGVKDLELHIFDRWGMRVHLDREEPINWDGTHMNTQVPLPQGVYPYVIFYRDINGGRLVKQRGSITIVR